MKTEKKNLLTRFLKKKELQLLKNFIKKNYKKNHIMVKSDKIYKYYFIEKKNRINFVGTFENKKLISILGVVRNRQWDKALKNDIQFSLWLNKKNTKTSGLENLLFILNKYDHHSIYTTGLNVRTSLKVFKLFSETRDFKHFFLPNPALPKKICKTKRIIGSDYKFDNSKIIKETYKIKSLPGHPYYPKKSVKFFNNKYALNPFYKYFFLEFYYKNKMKFFFVCRNIYLKKYNANVTRIVDFYGNLPKNLSFKNEILSFIIRNKIEYIDFLIFGISDSLIHKQGFILKRKNEIVPNYFEPFLKKNIKLGIAIIKNFYKDKLIIVKADSDQERKS